MQLSFYIKSELNQGSWAPKCLQRTKNRLVIQRICMNAWACELQAPKIKDRIKEWLINIQLMLKHKLQYLCVNTSYFVHIEKANHVLITSEKFLQFLVFVWINYYSLFIFKKYSGGQSRFISQRQTWYCFNRKQGVRHVLQSFGGR